MTTFKINQHYVWRNYLKEWANAKGQIACYMIKERRSFMTRPENIAVERFFYAITDLTELEWQWIDSLIERASEPEVRKMHRETVAMFRTPERMQSWLNSQKGINEEKRKYLQDELDKIRKTFGEEWHTEIETAAIPILEKLKNCDATFYEHEPDRINFVHFIAQQFFRTPKLRGLQIRENHPYFDQGLDLDRTWFFESQIFSTNVSTGIFIEQDQYKFKFIENDTDNKFITGDQPVISLGSHGIGFRLYYPLKPDLALIFEKDDRVPLKSVYKASELQINFYNSQIFKFSYNQIYGCTKDQLEQIASYPKDVLSE